MDWQRERTIRTLEEAHERDFPMIVAVSLALSRPEDNEAYHRLLAKGLNVVEKASLGRYVSDMLEMLDQIVP